MPIYDRPVRELVKEFVKEKGIQKGDIFSRSDAVSWFNLKYPRIKRGTITAHLMFMSTNKGSRVHHDLRPEGQDDLLFQLDRDNFRLYDKYVDPAPKYPLGDRQNGAENPERGAASEDDSTEPEGSGEFAYERDLKNYLAGNLHALEKGLSLYDEEGVKGIEFPVGGRFIDILAKDASGNFVVIELKVSRGYDRVIGQLLRYMAWIEQNLAETGQAVRGIIVASSISDDLKLAASKTSDVQLIEYALSLTFKRFT